MMTPLITKTLKNWPLVALLASMGMLAAAHSFERFAHLPPCALCLHQREAYWAAAGVALLGTLANRYRPDPLGTRAFNLLLVCAFGAGALIAGFHVGVEFKWWAGLAECAAGGPYNPSGDLLGSLSKSMDVPACDKVAWSMLGLSMAAWNMLISLGFAGVSALAMLYPWPVKETANV
jgi:disulfide bond formation protein DsbB